MFIYQYFRTFAKLPSDLHLLVSFPLFFVEVGMSNILDYIPRLHQFGFNQLKLV